MAPGLTIGLVRPVRAALDCGQRIERQASRVDPDPLAHSLRSESVADKREYERF